MGLLFRSSYKYLKHKVPDGQREFPLKDEADKQIDCSL